MNFLRRCILGLVVLLCAQVAFAVDLGRLESGLQPIAPQSFLYLLVVVVVLLTIGVEGLSRVSLVASLAAWGAIYLVLKLVVFDDATHPLTGGVYTYVSLAEVTFLVLSVLIARTIGKQLREAEQALVDVTVASLGPRLRAVDEAEDEIGVEIARSRRHGRPLSAIVLQTEASSLRSHQFRILREVERVVAAQYVMANIGRTLFNVLRRTDVVLRDDEKHRLVVICPETDAPGCRVLADRIRSLSEESLGIGIQYGVGSFPDDALTFGELVRHAESDLRDFDQAGQPPVPATGGAQNSDRACQLGQLSMDSDGPRGLVREG